MMSGSCFISICTHHVQLPVLVLVSMWYTCDTHDSDYRKKRRYETYFPGIFNTHHVQKDDNINVPSSQASLHVMMIWQCSIDFNFDTFRNTEVESKQCMRDHPPIAYRDAFGTALLLFNFTLTLVIKSRRTQQTLPWTLIPLKFAPRQSRFQSLSFCPACADWKVPSSKCMLLLIMYFSIIVKAHCKLLFIHKLKLLE